MGKTAKTDKKVFSGLDELPSGRATDDVTEGCIVLEGGAFRGVYTSGVLDALMEENINFQTTIGVSAGALNGLNYLSGQIGRTGRFNLMYRHDPRYVSMRNLLKYKSVIGFDFSFGDEPEIEQLDIDRVMASPRRLVVVASNCVTGKPEYYEKGVCDDIIKAGQASASMPFVSKPVDVCGVPCLDGGCTDKIPVEWAVNEGFKKIVVVRTRPDDYRKQIKKRDDKLSHVMYGKKYPEFAKALASSNAAYNRQCDEIERLKNDGTIFVISPSEPVSVGRLEKDMEKLGAFYYLGYNDAKSKLTELKEYLAR